MLKQKLKSDQNYNLSIYRFRLLLYYLSTYYYWGLPNFLFVSLIIKKKWSIDSIELGRGLVLLV